MRYEKIQLLPDRPEAYIELYGNDDVSAFSPAMLVIPGGGYGCVCADREGYPIALAYMMQGYTCFILHYSVSSEILTPYDPLLEASLAMIYIRTHAEQYKVLADKVFTVGFSAGGHLAASLAILWNDPELQKRISEYAQVPAKLNRPEGAVLCYAVINGTKFPHQGTFRNLLGSRYDEEGLLEHFSLNMQVTREASPVFVVHTFNDPLVPVENAFMLGMAYSAVKLPCEMHVYPDGPHGMALANKVTWCSNPKFVNAQYARWIEDSAIWMQNL